MTRNSICVAWAWVGKDESQVPPRPTESKPAFKKGEQFSFFF